MEKSDALCTVSGTINGTMAMKNDVMIFFKVFYLPFNYLFLS